MLPQDRADGAARAGVWRRPAVGHLLGVTSLQRYLPDRLRGRVAAVADFGAFVLLPLSFAVGGLVVEAVGSEVVLLAAGAIGMLAASIDLAVPAVHRWRPFDGDISTHPLSANGTEPSGRCVPNLTAHRLACHYLAYVVRPSKIPTCLARRW